jgi:glycosyltransferase 2 family protein
MARCEPFEVLPMTNLLKYGATFGLMAFFLYWAFDGINLADLGQVLLQARWPGLVLIIVITLCTLVIRAWRWRILMRPFAPQVTLRDATLALAVCYAANAVFPRSGEALRALSLKWSADAAFGPLMGTVVVERILDVIFLVVLVGLSFALLKERLAQAFPWLGAMALWTLGFCCLFLVGLGAAIILRQRALALAKKLLSPISPRLSEWLCNLLETFLDTLYSLQNPAAYLGIIISSILLNGGYVTMVYTSFVAFGLDTEYGLGFEAAVAVLAISSLGVIVPTPGGIGSYHTFFSQGLVLIFAVPAVPALACATALHAVGNLTYLASGGPAFLMQRKKANKPTTPA